MPNALIVEDNESFQRDLCDVISRYFPGIEIQITGDAKTAWQKLQVQDFDVVFVDIELPGESGLALTRRIGRSRAAKWTVVVTVHDLPEFREAALALGADYFIPKERHGDLERLFDTLQL